MGRILVLILCLSAAISLSGCARSERSGSTPASSTKPVITADTRGGVEKVKPAPGTGNVQGKVLYNSKPAENIEVKLCEKFNQYFGGCSGKTFTARTDKDGEKARPYTGSQIAGTGALIIGQVDRNEGVASPGWTGTRVPIVRRGGAARKDSDKDKDADKDKDKDGDKEAAKADPPAEEKENPLKKTLDSKILPEGKTNQPAQGLLYFPMEKQKMKDLELTYGGKENLIRLRFKPSPK